MAAAAAASGSLTECYYDVLGVAMEATDGEVRKAYRKAALAWHPDKNQHRVEEATERMKLITEAYSVLSDASERAWYDAHRESLLAGDSGGDESRMTPNLFPFFVKSCFDEFDDSERGFFTVYGRAFDSIQRAERRHRPKDGGKVREMPGFGKAEASWEEVSAFYRAWTNYSSNMTFAWEDAYRPSEEGGDRYTRRWMDRQNEKARSKARGEWIDLVQSLAKFARKRDPRYAKGLARAREERAAKAQAAEERRQRELEERARRQEELAEAAAEYREELEAAAGFRLADEAESKPRGRRGKSSRAAATASDPVSESSAVEAAAADNDDDDEADSPSPPTSGSGEASASAVVRSDEELLRCLPAEFRLAREALRELADDARAGRVRDADVLASLRADGTLPDSWSDERALEVVRAADEPMPSTPSSSSASSSSASSSSASSKPTKGSKVRACLVCGEEFDGVPALLAHIEATGHRKPTAKAKAAEAAEAGDSGAPAMGAIPRGSAVSSSRGQVCGVCGVTFASRTKLFKHIQSTGHALAKGEVASATSSASSSSSSTGKDKQGRKKKGKKGRRRGRRGMDDDDSD